MLGRIFNPPKFTGWHMLGVLGLFFGTIITVNMTLAVFAAKTWTGLVVQNSYVESQKFNAVTEAREQEAALGWKARLGYGEEMLKVDLHDAEGNPVHGAQVRAKVGRPAHENDDRQLEFTRDGNGAYDAATQLAPGLWQADITVAGPRGEQWRRSVRFHVKD